MNLKEIFCLQDVEHCFSHPLRNQEPVVLISAYIVIVLHILGQVSQRWSNFTLRLLKIMVSSVYTSFKVPLVATSSIIKTFSTDIRTLRKNLGLEPELVLYAMCPVCSATYAPQETASGIVEWPPTCTYQVFPANRPCNTPLTTTTPPPRRPIYWRPTIVLTCNCNGSCNSRP
jgi:hypothetical protein